MISSQPAPLPPNARQGNRLFVRRGTRLGPPAAPLPDRCVKCGQPSTRKLDRTFYWHAPWLCVTILAGLIPYVILALVCSKKIALAVPLCSEHDGMRRRWTLVGRLLYLLGVGTALLLGVLDVDLGICAGLAVLSSIAAIVVFFRAANPIRPTRIDELEAEFKGSSDSFLRDLPTRTAA